MSRFLLVLFISLSIATYAQTQVRISKEKYNFLVDSLSVEKLSLEKEKIRLNADIDSLKILLVDLEGKYQSARTNQLIRKYGKEIGRRVSSGQIWKGMTEKMLEDSWGKPDNITSNKEKWGRFSQWYYGKITYFFRDGKMTDWEEKE